MTEHLISLLSPASTSNVFQRGVVVIAVAKGTADLHPLLSTKHVFGERITSTLR